MRSLTLALALALALPLVAAESTITIDAADSGYTPPASVIASGDSVSWFSLDNTHVTVDTTVGGDPCMFAVSQQHAASAPVRFDVIDGALYATSDDLGTLPCGSAVMTAAGAVLPYHCLIHPLMRGALVVTAA